ncbi:cytochrome c oxidase subunit II [Rhodovibrio sodomensis]|uniref:Cytochrome c oxidase subunit 2 n=2 Tax=Rhodovibrio sodomensis TaxID=1088 RepID=A0ABS1DB77_9PROT|nr:cytochrome c oxidase subunit II [Rhodovibrio sodomensis]
MGTAGLLAAGSAAAQDSAPKIKGAPEPWQLGLQEAATPVMEEVQDFHNLLLVIITFITVLVLALMLYTGWRFHEKRNPTPSKTTHNTVIEVIWTAVPVIILVVIAIPSFKLLYYEDQVVDAKMTVKAIGRQWYWSYEYPDHGGISFDAFMIADSEIEPSKGELRQLSTNQAVVLPVDTNVRILTTSSDVLHSFAMPSMGVKKDAVPGQLNETWVRIQEQGLYYGQCSELCGVRHNAMPIEIKAVSKQEFEQWVGQMQAKQGITPKDQPQLADAEANAD